MPRPGPRTTYKYSDRFKATAVRLSELRGVSVQEVAESLYIHPFMLSRWRKAAREGKIVTKGVEVDKDVAAELKQLRKVKRDYERLKIEHELLKKAIEFTSKRKEHNFHSKIFSPSQIYHFKLTLRETQKLSLNEVIQIKIVSNNKLISSHYAHLSYNFGYSLRTNHSGYL